jgi:hypothetical protein
LGLAWLGLAVARTAKINLAMRIKGMEMERCRERMDGWMDARVLPRR